MKKVLLLNNSLKPCGVQQWGERAVKVLKESKKYYFIYAEINSEEDTINVIMRINPEIILYNYNPSTMYFLVPRILYRFEYMKHVAIIHEGYSYKDNFIDFDYFIYLIDSIDIEPDMKYRVFNTSNRYILSYNGRYPVNRIPTIGSFGFGFPSKRFDYIVEVVNREFDIADIRFSMSNSIHGDPHGDVARETIQRCETKITKPGIKLYTEQEFLPDDQLLEFLASNDINCFFYDSTKTDGIAGSIDIALSVKRPIAITKVPVFSHLYNLVPSICIENSTLKKIIDRGIAPLQSLYENKFSNKVFISEFERILGIIDGQ